VNRQITLIAMSGVRIYNEELKNLGMTLPGFIERGKVIASLPSLGLLTIAAHTPDDWEIDYREIDPADPDTIEAAAAASAELVAISSLSARINDAYKLADILRGQGKTVVIGGLHASVLPEEAQLHADAVVVGEGESIWAELVRDFESGNLKRRYFSERTRRFDPWKVPRYDLLDPEKYNRMTLQTTRGCPLDCSFCAASRLISHYKRKPIDQIEAELDAIEVIWPRSFIELADDNTFINKLWARELVSLLKSRNVSWFTESDIGLADDPELVDELAQSGCRQVLIGLEAIDESALDETDSKHWKRKRRDRYIESIHAIQSNGVSVNGCFVFGFDSHRPSVFEATSRFIEEANLSEVQLTILTPFPGTALYDRLRSEGRLLEDPDWTKRTLFDVAFRPLHMSAGELEAGFRNLVAEVYSQSATESRKSRFRDCVRRARGAKVE